MTVLLLIPTVLSALLFGAHLLHAGYAPLSALLAVAAMLTLIFVKRSWSARTLQVALLIAAAEWVFTGLNIAKDRMADGENWIRPLLILTVVALVNVAAAFLFRSKRLARRYRLLAVEAPAEEVSKTSAQGV